MSNRIKEFELHMDSMVKGLCEDKKIAFVYVDVTETAKELERRHLSGPTAGRVLGRALAGVALLSSNLGNNDERISIQMKVDGPVGRLLVDASYEGKLRGYTHTKVMNDHDGCEDVERKIIMGDRGVMAVVQSNAEKVIYSAQINATPPDIRAAVARYFNESLQRKAAVSLNVSSKNGYLDRAVALVVEKMPDGDTETFVEILELFESGDVCKLLETSKGLADFQQLFKLEHMKATELRELSFGCTCGVGKTIDSLKALAEEELREIVDSGESQSVTCHFCGETYVIPVDKVKEVLQHKKHGDVVG